MSTRCQIGFYSSSELELSRPDVVLYRHSDGYPRGEHGVLDVLVPFAQRFNKSRGLSDSSYAGARGLEALINATAPNKTIGYGIDGDRGLHGDIEFYYRVDPSGVYTYKVSESEWGKLSLLFHTGL